MVDWLLSVLVIRILEQLVNQFYRLLHANGDVLVTSFLPYGEWPLPSRLRYASHYYNTANATGSTITGVIMLEHAASETCSPEENTFLSREISDGRIVEIRIHRTSISTIANVDRSIVLSLPQMFNVIHLIEH